MAIGDYVIAYFVMLIFIGNFFVMNMMLAVIKAKFSEVHGEKESDPTQKTKKHEEEDDDYVEFCYTVKELSEYARFYQFFRRKRYYRH